MVEAEWMKRALVLAQRGEGHVEPNPMVGAVLVRHGEVVAEGWHRRFGEPHAEVEALRDAAARGIDPAGLTMAVTLEPCCHQGKTPPCADALIAAKVARVVVAMQDPFPQVAGRGIERLREARIAVEVGVLEDEAKALNAPFVKRVTAGVPWTIAKWAQTVDGKIATATGDSQWISGVESRRRVHELRGRVDAIVVGIGTVVADNPRLTAREVEVRRTARRVVIDPGLRIDEDAALLCDDGPPVLIAYEHREEDLALGRARAQRQALAARGVELFPLRDRCGRRLDLRPLWRHLAEQHDATNVLVEGGAGVLGSVFEQNLVDRVMMFVAPRIIGDQDAPTAIAGLACATMDEAMSLDLRSVERIEDDLLLDYRVEGRR